MTTAFHRLARETPEYAWWRLPVAGLLALVFFIGFTMVLVAVAFIAYAISSGGSDLEAWFDGLGQLDAQKPGYLALDLLSVAVLIPSVLLAVRITGPRPAGCLSSVAGRLRWRWLGRAMVVSFVVFIVTIGGSLAVTQTTGTGVIRAPSELGTRVVLALVVILLIVPFQAAAEEYVFRGYVLQLVGSWSRFAVIPVIVSVPLFVAGHAYGVWGLIDVGMFGLTAAVLTIRTGGLEVAIAAHTANNVVLFVLDAWGVISATDDSGAGPIDLVPTLISCAVLLLWAEWAATRAGIQRTRDPIPAPPPPLMPMWPPPPYAMVWWAPPPWQVAPQWPQPLPVPPPSRPALHPNTPDYPGELPSGWDR